MIVLVVLMTLVLGRLLFFHIPTFPIHKGRMELLKKVSVIIPARNEEGNLPALLKSLQAYRGKVKEIIVVDDHSTDDTVRVARSLGASVIKLEALPVGWFGKSFGCWNGALKATGNILLFLDADTIVMENGLENMLAAYRGKGEVISVQPYHRMKEKYESLSSFFHLVIMGSLGSFHILQKWTSVKGAFGQCLLIHRQDYFKYGGHEAIQGELMENMAFGFIVQNHGGKVRCFTGFGAIQMRMYPEGFPSLWRGWSKSFATGAAKTSRVYIILVSFWIGGLITFLTNFQHVQIEVWVAVYLLIALHIKRTLGIAGSFSWGSAFLFPVHLLFFIVLFGYSCFQTFFKRNISWKGRKIDL
ncbi:glycosyltransferase [Bacillus sp. LL01]|uniref:glycosyltransferase n=1 Tax=Bacillus sp. LL01 TaxID=1665556 RepID=UPI000A46F448|nr:glycosyltransferase [Bacillus sp. LL01]